jgi:hypothetical protein
MNPSVRNPVLDKLHHPPVIDRAEKVTDVCVKHPVHALPHDADPERVQRVVRTVSGSKSIRESQKVLFVNRVEDRYDGMLDDFVFQSGDAQGTLSLVRFRDVGSLGRLRSIRSLMHTTVEIGQPRIEVRLILLPRYAIDARCRASLEGVEAVLESRHRDMVEQRREPCPLLPTCDFPHTE